MTAKKFRDRIESLCTHVLFDCNGKACGVDTFDAGHFDMWCGEISWRHTEHCGPEKSACPRQGGAQTALSTAGIKLFGGVSVDADKAVEAFINETLEYNPDAKCSLHEHNHGEGHTCGEHGCGNHSCH